MIRYAVPFVAGIALTLAGLSLRGSSEVSASSRHAPRARTIVPRATIHTNATPIDHRVLLGELRDVVRGELEAQIGIANEHGCAPHMDEEVDTAQLHDADLLQRSETAYAEVNTLIDGALEAAYWGDADAAKFRSHLASLTQQHAEDVLDRLILGINSDQLRVETSGPPF